ncbi:MAG TPA: T9SS type A sorting domain-containing protein [Flavobacteriales bacterium]|nr:T9SS type A sorting domain-containing protein [Flavobacteriales bacterium]
MKISYSILVWLTLFTSIVKAQNNTPVSPCSADEILARHLENNPKALLEIEDNEDFTKAFVKQIVMERAKNNAQQSTAQYTIPVVLHVFHFGDDGKIDSAQVQSGIDILNTDFNGLNDDWNTIDPEFDSIKGTLGIQFCLASLDPNGNSTPGVIYYEDSLAMLNIPDLFQYAWDNYKYLNIYLPKYTGGSPSLFTAYAYYPSTTGSNNNAGGIFYSSIRWGYGSHSELIPGQDWASVGTHEAGHWLNLRHTFQNGCDSPGDYVDDTPPTLGGAIELSGCTNNDLSCIVSTNGENYMDYNHDCKKMFTEGQVDRMTAALNLPSRITLWSPSNLAATGCTTPAISILELVNSNSIMAYPNPAKDHINFQFEQIQAQLSIYNAQGKLVFDNAINGRSIKVNTNDFGKGLYFYYSTIVSKRISGKFLIE